MSENALSNTLAINPALPPLKKLKYFKAMQTEKERNPWLFVPTLYFAEGLPYIIINTASVILYKNMGVSNGKIAFWTSWLYLPWVIKMLWAPLVDTFGTRRLWIFWTQLAMSACLAAAAFSLLSMHFFASSLFFFALGAFISATHDIAADGYYMLALSAKDQAFFVGIRSTFYRLAMIFGTGFLVFSAGKLQRSFSLHLSWALMLVISALILCLFSFYHKALLPYPAEDYPKAKAGLKPVFKALCAAFFYLLAAAIIISAFMLIKGLWLKLMLSLLLLAALVFAITSPKIWGRLKIKAEGSINSVFIEYFSQSGIVWIISFILLYRLGEALLGKMASPFLLDPISSGGLGLSVSAVGIIYGTIGISGLVLGGILGGWLISKYGFCKCLWPMAFALNAPDLFYVYLAYAKPIAMRSVFFGLVPDILISILVFAEQFGYGLGFTAFTVYLMLICRGKYKTAHYAISTGIMALGMMLPGMLSGVLQEALGYKFFFIAVCILTVPGMLVIFKLPLPAKAQDSRKSEAGGRA